MHKSKFSLLFTPLDVQLTKVMDLCGSFIPKHQKSDEFNSREEEPSLSNKLKKEEMCKSLDYSTLLLEKTENYRLDKELVLPYLNFKLI